uniref:Uncharacterized protein n=1 Tax=Anguilla anguilla TaxID=7936 RepID=A0A0E9TK98_ANGAN
MVHNKTIDKSTRVFQKLKMRHNVSIIQKGTMYIFKL